MLTLQEYTMIRSACESIMRRLRLHQSEEQLQRMLTPEMIERFKALGEFMGEDFASTYEAMDHYLSDYGVE